MKRGNGYDKIFNNSHTPMLIIDSETGKIKDGNLAACNYYGYSKDKLLQLNISDINILSPRQMNEEMQEAKREDRKYFRFRHRLSNGEIREVEVYSWPVTIGKESLLLFIIHDVEDKKEIERRIRIQESYFKSLYENSPEAIAILDNEFRILSINKSFERIFQYKLDEIRNQNITKVICDEKFYDESVYFRDNIMRGEFVRQETMRRRKDGTLIEVSFLGFPIMSEGEQIGAYAIYSDISSIEEERRRYEQYLKEAKLKAEEASKFKSQFIASMTHEIRTPMNGIAGIIELLEETQISDEQREYFQMLKYSAERLASIINAVLDISKIEAGKLELRNLRFNISKLLSDVAGYYKIIAERKGLELKCNINPDIPDFLIGDSDKLNQILFNLMSNAVKYTDKGFIGIDAKLVEKTEGYIGINFSIRDTGIGIPKDKTQRIFEEFFQLETTNNRKYSGTGLGLSIARKLAQLMDSDIVVESEYGKGSTFSFTVKFPVPECQKDMLAAREDEKGKGIWKYAGLSILVAEDDEVNRKILKTLLEKRGCKVALAVNGAEALDILEKQSFDVILMDIYMPHMSGCDTSRRIREMEAGRGRRTPIIAITAAVQNEEREKYIEAGMDGCIAKPFSINKLCSMIEEVLGSSNEAAGYSLEQLVESLDGDYELLNAIIDEVVSFEYEKKFFGGLEACIKEKDTERMSKYLHKLKGSLSYFRSDAINEILKDLKEKCKSRDFRSMERLYDRLKHEYELLRNYLISYKIGEKQ